MWLSLHVSRVLFQSHVSHNTKPDSHVNALINAAVVQFGGGGKEMDPLDQGSPALCQVA